jgi:hypothetical protein
VRLVYAGLFILGGVLCGAYIGFTFYPQGNPFELRFSLPLLLGLIVAAHFLFQERGPWITKGGVTRYRKPAELVPTTYQSRRAFEVKNPDSGDRWYVVELENGKVLCLCDNLPSGPLGFDPMNPDVQRFPCTEFTLLRHPTEKFIGEIDCGGKLIQPVTVLFADHYSDWVYTRLSVDGEIIPDRTFNEVLAEAQEEVRKEAADPRRQGN